MMKKLFMAFALVLLCSAASFAQKSTITLINKSGIDFYGVMMSASDDDEWSDVMEDETLGNGEYVEIEISDKNEAWDIRFFTNPDDLESGYIDFRNLVFGRYKVLTLLIDEEGELAYSLQ